METTLFCSTCGQPLEANAPRGLCPACLMQGAFPTGTEPDGKTPRFRPPAIDELAPKFPHLEILSFVGQGGMGAVYKAKQKELDRIVALKILPPDIGKDAAFTERFMREARALAKLNHPGIVTIHDFGRADGLHFFLMEYVDGVSLQQLLARSGVSTREALTIVPEICDALQYAHDQGIVHRDIKPENILLDRRGRVKVADFGLAKLMGGSGELSAAQGAHSGDCALTEAGKVLGTPKYMSPEQTDKPAEVDHRADIYALGVVFYQMLTGELPGKPFEPPSRKVALDVRLDEVVLRALEKQPERRYQQVSEVKTQIETITSSIRGSAPASTRPGAAEPPAAQRRGTLPALALLAGLLALFFWRSFVPGSILFSNDRPLGLLNADWMHLPAGFTGRWADLNSLGFNAGSFGETLSTLLLWALGPLGSSKFQAPATLFLLGVGAWFLFWRLDFSRPAALLGAVAVVFNSSFLATACWGTTQAVMGVAVSYLAIGLVVSGRRAMRRLERWGFHALAGLAIGVGVLEAAELGFICGLMVLIYLLYSSLLDEGALRVRLARGLGWTLVVTACAALMAGQAVSGLLRASLEGVEAELDAPSKAQRWNWATQWSLPKSESAGLLIPGLFGYRMDTPEGGCYWGGIGRDPAVDEWLASDRRQPQPPGMMRFGAGSLYIGVPVALVVFWAVLRAFRKNDAVFALSERRQMLFWSALAVACLALAFGRFAPFYGWACALPCFSTMRNPIQFLHPLMLAVSVLFAYGLNGLLRQYVERAPVDTSPLPLGSRFRAWWACADGFDRRWTLGCAVALLLSLAGWLLYAGSHATLDNYLQTVGFDRVAAGTIAAFSARQAAWFLVFFGLDAGLLVLVVSGAFGGARARWAALVLGSLLVLDLGRANLPWLSYWEYKQKYASNDVIRFLQPEPYKHRVTLLPFHTSPEAALLYSVYHIAWAQHQLPYYNIQSLDIVALPRMPKDLAAYESAFAVPNNDALGRLARRWQLTNTRYLLGPAALLQSLNNRFDPVQQRFHIVHAFDLVPAVENSRSDATVDSGASGGTVFDGLTAVFNTHGQYAIFEFTGALPRARLYDHWQVSTNDPATLEQLTSPGFDPEQTVMVDHPLPGASAAQGTVRDSYSSDGGTVQFVSYAPKEIILQTRANSTSVLLLNDRFDPQWGVTVDGKPATLLRCNYIMRGVQLEPGAHTVRFSFQIPLGKPLARLEVEPDTQLVSFVFHIPTGLPSYVTLAAYGMGAVLIVVLARRSQKRRGEDSDPGRAPGSASVF